jgi:hypothetical protein
MEWAAFAVALIGALGIGSWFGGLLERRHASVEAEKSREHASSEARAEREHASKEARAQRLWAFRLDVYGAAAIYLETQAAVLAWTDPLTGPMPEPPKIEPDEEWIQQGAKVAIGCSDRVRKAMQAAAEAHMEFNRARDNWRGWQNGLLESSDPTVSPRQKMDDARTAAIAAIRHAQTVMRDELESM